MADLLDFQRPSTTQLSRSGANPQIYHLFAFTSSRKWPLLVEERPFMAAKKALRLRRFFLAPQAAAQHSEAARKD
jgi:hypothetical protein